MSTPTSSQTRQPNLQEISLWKIRAKDDKNGRLDHDPAHIDRLASAIQSHGLINPITVRPDGDDYELIAGNCRLLAARSLGWSTIACNVQPYDTGQAAVVRLSENVQRRQLSPVDEANGLHELVEAHDQGVDGVAADLGRSPNWILNRLDILSWQPLLIEYVHAGLISQAAAKHLARIRDPEKAAYYIDAAGKNAIDARTASLWRQQSETDLLDDSTMAENPSCTISNQPQTNVTVVCYACKARLDIGNCMSVHICAGCHQVISPMVDSIPTPPNV